MSTATIKERPILFSGPMIRAILDGQKTQTRRVIKPQPDSLKPLGQYGQLIPYRVGPEVADMPGVCLQVPIRCPYGQAGDRLWVREAFDYVAGQVISKDGSRRCESIFYRADQGCKPFNKWTPSIHMPRWASRLTLEITRVRVEQLHDIRERDAQAEGIRQVTKDGSLFKYCVYDQGDYSLVPWADMSRTAVGAFAQLWDSINAKRGFGWEFSDPWLWVVEFKRV